MPKEILLYSSIYDFTAENFINKMEAASSDDIVLRINTPGGDPQAGFGMIAKFAEHKGLKSVKVDGKANSMGAFFLAFAEDVEALDVSEIILHRAAFPAWVEAAEDFKSSGRFEQVVKINKDLRAKLEDKIDVEAFEKTTKVSMDEMFSMDSRIDVSITPAQAKKIGLVNKITKLTSKMSAEIQSNTFSIAAEYGLDVKELQVIKKEPQAEVINDKPKTIKKMNIDELKASHPGVYNEIYNLGSTAALAERNDTVEAWLTFNDVDSKAVVEGIKSGKKLSQAATAEFTIKMVSATNLKNEEAGSNVDLSPEDSAKAEAAAQSDEKSEDQVALAELDSLLGINQKNNK